MGNHGVISNVFPVSGTGFTDERNSDSHGCHASGRFNNLVRQASEGGSLFGEKDIIFAEIVGQILNSHRLIRIFTVIDMVFWNRPVDLFLARDIYLFRTEGGDFIDGHDPAVNVFVQDHFRKAARMGVPSPTSARWWGTIRPLRMDCSRN